MQFRFYYSMKQSRVIFIACLMLFFVTACATGGKQIHSGDDANLSFTEGVFFVATAATSEENVLSLTFRNKETLETTTIWRSICSGGEYGIFSKLLKREHSDHLRNKEKCGNIFIGALPSGEYDIVELFLQPRDDRYAGRNNGSEQYDMSRSHSFRVRPNSITHLGRLDVLKRSGIVRGVDRTLWIINPTSRQYKNDFKLLKQNFPNPYALKKYVAKDRIVAKIIL